MKNTGTNAEAGRICGYSGLILVTLFGAAAIGVGANWWLWIPVAAVNLYLLHHLYGEVRTMVRRARIVERVPEPDYENDFVELERVEPSIANLPRFDVKLSTPVSTRKAQPPQPRRPSSPRLVRVRVTNDSDSQVLIG